MSSQTFSLGDRVRLSGMMFLQYMMLPVWFMPLAAYLDKLNVVGSYRAAIVSSMALGCLASPLIGMVADRYFASERVLAVLNLVAAILLVLAAQFTEPLLVFLLLLGVMLCYMPTWGLTSSIAMSHSPAEKFPQIRVFGSVGWVAAGLFSLVGSKWYNVDIDGTAITLYCAGATAFVAAVFALALPHTPPPAKGKPASPIDVLGLRAVGLMKELSFAVLILTYTLAQIPFSIYFSYFSLFLKDKGFKFMTITMGWGVVAEMLFMLMIPLVIARVGLKWAMSIGLIAMVVRYSSLLVGGIYDMTWLYFVAILVHGLIFGFYFIGAQIFVDRRAPSEIKAQAQAFLFFCYGIGSLAGNFVNEKLINANTLIGSAGEKIYQWNPVWTAMTLSSIALLVVFVVLLHDKRVAPSEAAPALAKAGK